MIPALFLIFVALLVLGFLLWGAFQRRSIVPEQIGKNLCPVDLQAFRTLVSSEDQEYLRANLPPGVFRAVQRRRLWAAAEYVSAAAANAALLTKLGDAARRSPEPELARAGQELVEAAVRLRFFSLMARARFYTGMVWPSARLAPLGVADRYVRVTGLAGQIRRLQQVRPAPMRAAS